jgi:hypothetical protein
VSTEFYWLAVVITTIVSAARITRLATVDKFPPTAWVRHRYVAATVDNDWKWLVLCGYCFSFWATGAVLVWGLLAHVYGHPPNGDGAAQVWWAVNGIFAVSYLAGILMANDGDDGDDD